jgi:hypothetical protein
MHRNTYVVILTLSVFAALIVGLNLGKTINKPVIVNPTPSPVIPDETQIATPTSTIQFITPPSSPSSVTTIKSIPYINTSCGVALTYPNTLTATESTTKTAGVMFADKVNPNDVIVLTCQKDIPRPPLPEEQTEGRKIGSVSAILYHDTSAQNGTKTDALMFTHPKTNLDVFIGGYGPAFNAIIQSIKIQ